MLSISDTVFQVLPFVKSEAQLVFVELLKYFQTSCQELQGLLTQGLKQVAVPGRAALLQHRACNSHLAVLHETRKTILRPNLLLFFLKKH